MELNISNVRSFPGHHHIKVKPLTILVGENSSGKTTLLATLAAALQPTFPLKTNFNSPPFDMGAYETIASYRGSRWRASSFGIGITIDHPRGGESSIHATYHDRKGQPDLVDVNIRHPRGTLSLVFTPNIIEVNIDFSGARPPIQASIERAKFDEQKRATLLGFLLVNSNISSTQDREVQRDLMSRTLEILSLVEQPDKKPVAICIAPVRTKPRRTYDPIAEDFQPEGDHIPFTLASVWAEAQSVTKRKLEEALDQFGRESGLFDEIEVRQLGKKQTNPFQLLFRLGGPPVNLQDIGYGVSQSLPIIVEGVLSSEPRLLLLQQPEVHLHPKAQAALGSFFARLAAKGEKEFVIETHSDYLIDRVRQHVKTGDLNSSDVSILFLERKKTSTTIHPISLDSEGNVINAPPTYRKFFLEESMRTLFE